MLGKPHRGLALAGEALVGAIRLEIHFLNSARIELNTFSVVRLYIDGNQHIGELTLSGRVSQENSVFVYTPPVAHPFYSPWCYIIIK